MNILHLTPDFNYYDGRSYYVYLLLKYQKLAGHNVFLATNGGDSYDRLEDLNIQAITIPTLSGKRSFLTSSKKIADLIKELDINIVHSHHRYYELLAKSASKGTKVRTVFTALSIVDKRYFVEYRSDVIIAVSEAVRKMLINKFGVRENRIRLIPNFVDSQEIQDHTSVRRSSRKLSLLTVGRFQKEKNYLTLLKALTLLKDKSISLVMVGDGEEKELYKNFAEKNDIDVKFISPARDLTAHFEKADICVLTSVRDPLPTFMLQSGLHKKPFIGSNVDGIAEVIEDGVNGLLFEKRNAEELSVKIKLLMSDASLADKCADELHSLVMNDFTEKKVIPEILKVYTELLSHSSKTI